MLRGKIKEFFEENPDKVKTAVDIASILKITRETASRHLNKLEKERFLDKDSLKPRSFWLKVRSESHLEKIKANHETKESQSQSLKSQSQSQSQSLEPEEFELSFKDQPRVSVDSAQAIMKMEEEKFTSEIKELNTTNETLKETITNQKQEIKSLKSQSSKVDPPEVALETFTEFSKELMKGAIKTGSNSYRKGEIVFRRSGIKNMYIIYSEKILAINRKR